MERDSVHRLKGSALSAKTSVLRTEDMVQGCQLPSSMCYGSVPNTTKIPSGCTQIQHYPKQNEKLTLSLKFIYSFTWLQLLSYHRAITVKAVAICLKSDIQTKDRLHRKLVLTIGTKSTGS